MQVVEEMTTTETIIQYGAVAGSISAIIALIYLAIKHLRPLIGSIEQLNQHIETAPFSDMALRTLLRKELSELSATVITRGWHTVTEHQTLEDGLKSYRGLGGNSQVETKVKMAMKTDIAIDKIYQRALKEEQEK